MDDFHCKQARGCTAPGPCDDADDCLAGTLTGRTPRTPANSTSPLREDASKLTLLLKKYIEWIKGAESITYLEGRMHTCMPSDHFTEEEWQLLEELSGRAL